MPGFTTPDSLIHEVEGDQPLISLTGGSSGTFPILAEQVQALFSAFRADLTDVTDRLTAVESIAAATRWRHIDTGTVTGGSFLVTVPAGFQRLRFVMAYDQAAAGTMFLRINDDATSGNHIWGFLALDSATGAVDHADHSSTTGTNWKIGDASSVESNNLTVEIWPTDGSHNPSFVTQGHRNSTSASSHQMQLAAGKYLGDVVVSSFRIQPVTELFASARWWLEGYVAP
jgi:hypothetical protein